jgi:hypothetical protein
VVVERPKLEQGAIFTTGNGFKSRFAADKANRQRKGL